MIRWGCRAASALLACCLVVLLGAAALAAVTPDHPAVTVTPSPAYAEGSGTFSVALSAEHPFTGVRLSYLCTDSSGFASSSYTTTPGTPVTLARAWSCAAPAKLLTLAVRAVTSGTTTVSSPLVEAWVPDEAAEPVVSPSPYPVPGPTVTHYAYPEEPAVGGSCGGPDQSPCAVVPAADSPFSVDPAQFVTLEMGLGLLVFCVAVLMVQGWRSARA